MNYHQNTPSNNMANIQRSHSKEKPQKYISAFTNFSSHKNHINNILSENQRNINKLKTQKKLRQKDSYSKNLTENKHSTFFEYNNVNNIKLKNFSNLMIKNSKIMRNLNNKSKNKTKNKSQSLLKPNLEIETHNSNTNNDNMSTNTHSRLNTNNNRRYKKNISEYDLVNNILTTFTNYNFPKNVNPKINNFTNYSTKKKISYNNKNKLGNNNNGIKRNNNNINPSKAKTTSDTKLFRSSSGYSYINNNLICTNSFFNGFNGEIPNQINYIPTWGNSPEYTNSNINTNENNNNQNNSKQKNNKAPFVGKIIKNYKNNDLNCIFNMNLIPPMTSVNNIQDYFKNLYKLEYNGDRKNKKQDKNSKKEKENEGINLKIINEENKKVGNNKINETKNNNDIEGLCESSVEEIHYYYVYMIQGGKNLETKLIKK